jgi:putative transcription factor
MNRQPKDQKPSKKQAAFDSAFDKFAKQLPKEYVDQFKKPDIKRETKEQKVKEAMRSGKKVEVVNKSTGNKAHPVNVNISKVLDDEGVLEIKEVPKEIASQVAKIRAEKKLTQEQLATKISEKTIVVKDLEAATGVYDPKVVEKIEKALGVKFDRPWKHK